MNKKRLVSKQLLTVI